MEDFNKQHALPAKQQRRHQWIESLASLRRANEGDITIICEDKEFAAHRWLLEFTSPYFVTMFHSEFEEAKSGKVEFKEMEADTLEIVLDFIYLGEVGKMNTENQVKQVLKAAHMLDLKHLVQYCSKALIYLLSAGNYIEFWNLSIIYEIEELKHEVLIKCTSCYLQPLVRKDCISLSVDQLKDLFNFAKGKLNSLDPMVQCLLIWLWADLKEREKYAEELFMCIDAQLLSKKYVKSLLQNEKMAETSGEIFGRIKDLAVGVLLSESDQTRPSEGENPQNCVIS